MKKLIRWIALPGLLLAGLILVGAQTADAGVLHRHARRAHAHRHYHAAAAVLYAPPVRVYAPPVRVYTPGIRVHVGPWVHSHYGHPYYYGW